MITAEAVSRIIRFDSDGLPVVSCYVRIPEDPYNRREVKSQVDSLLHELRPRAEDKSLDHDTRMSLRGDVERIDAVPWEQRWRLGTLAIFSCSGRRFYQEVGLPRGVRERVVVDTTPYVRPLLAVLDEFHPLSSTAKRTPCSRTT